MGGYGSGRPARWPSLWSLHSVRAKHVREACGFRPGLQGSLDFADGVRVSVVTVDGAVLVNGVPVPVIYTRPHFGGRRAWFRCPNCSRRCTLVYGRNRQWGCRCCWRANYPSQKEDRLDRLVRRAGALRRRLGDATIDHVHCVGIPPDKPRGMHWRTYDRLTADLEHVEREIARLFHEQARRLLGRLDSKGASLP